MWIRKVPDKHQLDLRTLSSLIEVGWAYAWRPGSGEEEVGRDVSERERCGGDQEAWCLLAHLI